MNTIDARRVEGAFLPRVFVCDVADVPLPHFEAFRDVKIVCRARFGPGTNLKQASFEGMVVAPEGHLSFHEAELRDARFDRVHLEPRAAIEFYHADLARTNWNDVSIEAEAQIVFYDVHLAGSAFSALDIHEGGRMIFDSPLCSSPVNMDRTKWKDVSDEAMRRITFGHVDLTEAGITFNQLVQAANVGHACILPRGLPRFVLDAARRSFGSPPCDVLSRHATKQPGLTY